jgi:hypothetical protein
MSSSPSRPHIEELAPVLFGAGALAVAIGVVGVTVMVQVHRPKPEPIPAQQVAAERPAVAPAPDATARPAEPEPEPISLTVGRVRSAADAIDPFAELWGDAPSIEIPLDPQMLAVPMLEHATIETAQVQALTDGHTIAWRVSWEVDSPSTIADTGIFPDAVAFQFPLDELASYMMGGPDAPVHVLYWRAQWQKDIDERFQDIYAMYPNFWSCGYWFAEGDFPPRVPEAFTNVYSHQWFVAKQAGNPMADFNRTSPVDEMLAEGFGSLTYKPDGTADGRGEWRDGRWFVVFVRPVADDELSRLFRAGAPSQFGVAVWDGEAGNVGGRKHYSFWVPFEVER